ncbi:heparinase II/III domain-containing protein [Longimicrobium sp.]|uniref:heparinase II/III domain-containing protein n=1 Tax=Longimicrobium sp. TaxID=2029185 RepID=UPI002EDA9C0F
MLPVDRWPQAVRTVARTYGARGATLRALHEARKAAGRFRPAIRFPVPDAPVAGVHPFRVDGERLRSATDLAAAVERADRVADGFHHAYRWTWKPLPSTPAEWLAHPGTGHSFGDAPWWTVPHLGSGGDIKDVWEPGRFGWVYDLVRGWLVTGDTRYVDAFRRHFDTWRASSPPFRGPHWGCGQETAIRAAALLYAEANLPPVEGIAPTLAASGERIADAIGYAVSQHNNHSLSEAAGLVCLGVRFRGAHPEAERWLRSGRRWLARLVTEQFAPDGWYVQHSFTYLRLALDQCVVAERALRAAGLALPDEAVARLKAGVALLLAVMEGETGTVPNHGANDGAFVHPVTTAGVRDFRPVVTAACATWGIPLPDDVPADPEALAWLGLRAPPAAPARGNGVCSGSSGWAVARVGGACVFLRAGRYTSRPSHMDPLHLDVSFGGREVVVDAGTFAYNAPPPWKNGLTGARVHNGPVLDGREPGVRGPRFLWYIWPEADMVEAELGPDGATLVAEVPGRISRTVRVTAREVTVEDRIEPGAAREATVGWLLHPDAPAGAVRVDGPREVVEAVEGDTAGWYSPAYGERIASRRVQVRRPAAGGAVITTFIVPDDS